jgi:hypothetical protein
MNRTLASLLLATLPAVAGAADVGVPAAGAPVVFQLSPDGEWLGAIRQDADPAGAGWVLAPRMPSPGTGGALTIGGLFSLPAADGTRIAVGAQAQQWTPARAVVAAPPTWCQGIVGMMADTPECAAQGLAGLSLQPVLTRRQGVAGIGGRDWDVALGLGTSSGWSPGSGLWVVTPGSGPGSLLADPGGWSDSREINLSGQWRLAPWGGLSVSASVGDGHWQMLPGTAPLALDQAAVQVGLFRGPFSGGITGRVLRPAGGLEAPGALWGGLDIGFAWRTPWRGELSIGARNVVGGSREPLPAPAAPVIDEATARTPYVRYTQDL